MVAVMQQLDKLGEVQGACERLLLTPLPFPYTLLVHRTVYLYILLAPFAMADDMYNGLGIILPRDCQSTPRPPATAAPFLGPRAA